MTSSNEINTKTLRNVANSSGKHLKSWNHKSIQSINEFIVLKYRPQELSTQKISQLVAIKLEVTGPSPQAILLTCRHQRKWNFHVSLGPIKFLLEGKPINHIAVPWSNICFRVNNLNQQELQKVGVTHILSVVKSISRFDQWEKCKHLIIEALDIESQNLLQYFELSGAWIEEALRDGNSGKPGAVFVHCEKGISRSITIVLAYLLRKNSNLSVFEALSQVRACRPIAYPNEGFMAQLELYRKMGCTRDILPHHEYQNWIYQRALQQASNPVPDPSEIRYLDEQKHDEDQKEARSILELRCRKCRQILATSPFLVEHWPRNGLYSPDQTTDQDAASHPRRVPALQKICHSYYVEPLSWMKPTLEMGLLGGRLQCPNNKCSSLVGRYAWGGHRCSCRTWVCPYISLQKSRIDEHRISPSSILS